MSPMFCFLLCFISNVYINNGQICSNGLQSPLAVTHGATGNDIEWTEVGINKYAYTLTYDVSIKQWADDLNVRIVTRLHNDGLPSPTLRFQRGKQYQITLINNLGPESIHNPREHNEAKDANTTNIHTHGLHIGGLQPGDNVYIKLEPGQQHTYIYNIPCDHSGGLFWYHPHHHGSIEAQVSMGAAGPLIIEDHKINENLPDWYTNMRELIFFITHMNLQRITNRVNKSWDFVWEWQKTSNIFKSEMYLVNGEYRPNICMTSGEWIKFRFGHAEPEVPRKYYIGNGECKVYLLARDGVIIHGINDTDVPRYIPESVVWLAQPSRADVAVFCPGDVSGDITYPIWINETGIVEIIATIQVTGNQTVPTTELTPFTPQRPGYLENLLDGYYSGNLPTQMYQGKNGGIRDYWKNVQVTPTGIYDAPFVSETNYLTHIEVNTINTWEVTNLGIHPFHVHINHFQIIQSDLEQPPTGQNAPYYPPNGYQTIGDWQDTIWGPGLIRFKTDIWAGTITMHCHILRHEDDGAMGTVEIVNGCDNNYKPYSSTSANFSFDPICDYIDTCNQFTTSPTAFTGSPSKSPSKSPTTKTQTTSPSAAPTINTTCNGHIYWDHIFTGVNRFGSSAILTKIDEAKQIFLTEHSECVSNTNTMDYVYKYKPNRSQQRLRIWFIVCCGDDNLFEDDFILPVGYQDPDDAFNVIDDIWFDEDSSGFGVKQIVVLVLVAVIVIVGCIISVVFYREYKAKKVKKEIDENNTVTNSRMSIPSKSINDTVAKDTRFSVRLSVSQSGEHDTEIVTISEECCLENQ